ncbi:MAG: RNA polymerase sigma factor [Solirubrobacterales bacterium]
MSEAAATAGLDRLFSDDRLTRRAVAGDQRAFAAIFRRYHQPLYRFCLAIVGNPDDAQEALQNTMAKVLRALPGEEREIELKPWLYRIAHNESIDLLRRRRETRELDVEQVAPGYGLAEDVATRERLRGLLADLRELPERQREVLVMRELSGLDFEEIGAALGTSDAVARQTLYEARQSLRQMDEGREMSCVAVTKALSDGDGRVIRRRDVRAHLRACADCRRFGEEIETRERDLAALSPLPAVAAAGMLHGLLGGTQGASAGGGLAATLGGGAAKTVGVSVVAKGVATVAVVAAIGVTAADKSGVIHLGLPGDRAAKSSTSATQGGSAGAHGDSSGAASTGAPAGAAHAGNAGSSQDGAKARAGSTASHSQGHRQAHQHGHGGAVVPDPSGEHPSGRGHEQQHPTAATQGQEAAAAHQPAQQGSGGGAKSEHAASPPTSSPPSSPPAEPPAHPPASPPAAAPEAPSQSKPSIETIAPAPAHETGPSVEKDS